MKPVSTPVKVAAFIFWGIVGLALIITYWPSPGCEPGVEPKQVCQDDYYWQGQCVAPTTEYQYTECDRNPNDPPPMTRTLSPSVEGQ